MMRAERPALVTFRTTALSPALCGPLQAGAAARHHLLFHTETIVSDAPSQPLRAVGLDNIRGTEDEMIGVVRGRDVLKSPECRNVRPGVSIVLTPGLILGTTEAVSFFNVAT
jgi:hypothetical protein